ncbi:hypothetical protein JOF56_005088 [Kibdelosporangium banguiense]|uniref:Uncharacterized protein n=1 Tax=Kibdelosporangium banguiense TaxID=1365924 RepID=A0ABS4TJW5_9PSEU|nr:hypothetical protein [Kibdelosporangium banguiense]
MSLWSETDLTVDDDAVQAFQITSGAESAAVRSDGHARPISSQLKLRPPQWQSRTLT